MIGTILCRLGLHSWKPHFRWVFKMLPYPSTALRHAFKPLPFKHWHWRQYGCRCRRCGKRVDL